MEEIDWVEIVPDTLKFPYKIYKNRKVIHKYWTIARTFLDIGPTNIAVFGRPNVGKTVMLDYLMGESMNIKYDLPGASKLVERKPVFFDGKTRKVKILPGQTMLERHKGVDEVFGKKNKLDGIIYVVDFGFTDVRDNIVKRTLIKEVGIENIDDLRKYNLNAELTDFKDLCSHIKRASAVGNRPKWICVVANKCDLFFEESLLSEAESYYHRSSKSEFALVVDDLLNSIGGDSVKYSAKPLCSFKKSFEWNGDIKVSSITEEQERKALAMHFFKTIDNLY